VEHIETGKNFFPNLLDSMTDLVRVIDKSNVVIYENSAFKNVFKDTYGKKCYKTICENSFCPDCPFYKSVNSKTTEKHFGDIVIKGRIYSVALSSLNDENGVIAIVEVFRDITSEHNIKEKIIGSNKKMVKEIELAKSLQLSILRDKLPDIKGYKFSSIFLPCETLGGDMYDCFKISENEVAMYIADVSGHGVMAAMLTVYLRQEIFSQFKTKKMIDQVLKGVQESFLEMNIESSVYITVFMIVLDIKTGLFKFVNAGHSVAPIIFDGDKVSEIFSPGNPISSWFETPVFTVKDSKLKKGGKLLLFTDGLDEIHTGTATLEGLKKLVDQKKVLGERLLDKIIKKYASFSEDDITLLIAERE
jgi:phosphoserine phosphatase RsbU/P